LNTGGTLACLTRTESSGFAIEQSLSFEDLEMQLQEDKFSPILPSEVLGHLGAIVLSPEYAKRWFQGQRLPIPETPEQEGEEASQNDLPQTPNPLSPYFLQVYNEDGQFLGIGQVANSDTNTILSPQIVF
jgi:tRNA pseudouridine55 synthase